MIELVSVCIKQLAFYELLEIKMLIDKLITLVRGTLIEVALVK